MPQALLFAYHSQIWAPVATLQIVMDLSAPLVAGHKHLLPIYEPKHRRGRLRQPLHQLKARQFRPQIDYIDGALALIDCI